MKPGIFVTVIAAMTFATLLGCSDDGMEQYYKDAQFRGTAWRPSVGENVVSLTEFKTACEILVALDFRTNTEDFRKSRLDRYEELNPNKVDAWLNKFNPSKWGNPNNPRRSRAMYIIGAIRMPAGFSDDPPDYWGDKDHYFEYDPSDADYPPKGFCKYVAGLEKPPISDRDAQKAYDEYIDDLVEKTYKDAQYYLESEIGNKTHLRKYYEDLQADLQAYRNVSEIELLTACEFYERMDFQFPKDMQFGDPFWLQKEVEERLNDFNPTYDEIVKSGLFDAQTSRAVRIMLSIENPRSVYLLNDAVPVETREALCEYVATR